MANECFDISFDKKSKKINFICWSPLDSYASVRLQKCPNRGLSATSKESVSSSLAHRGKVWGQRGHVLRRLANIVSWVIEELGIKKWPRRKMKFNRRTLFWQRKFWSARTAVRSAMVFRAGCRQIRKGSKITSSALMLAYGACGIFWMM